MEGEGDEMTGFWLNVLWTVVVIAVTLLADRIAGRLIVATRCVRAIRRSTGEGATDREKLERISRHLEGLRAQQAAALVWGANLAAVALALDLAALGISIRDPDLFPFFGRWSTGGAWRAIEIWRVLLLSHLALLLLTIGFKHLHSEGSEVMERASTEGVTCGVWVGRYKWVLLSNSLGFLALLSSFVVLTNAV